MGETDSNGVIRIMKQMNKGTRKMLALIEAAKGDLEVVKEDDLMGMIENINDDTYFEKIKPTTQKTVESSITVSQKRKQSAEKTSVEELTTKKRSVTGSKEPIMQVSDTTCDTSVTTKKVKSVKSDTSVSDSKVCDSVVKEEKKLKPKEKEKLKEKKKKKKKKS